MNLGDLLSTGGRWNRAKFLLGYVLLSAIFILLYFLLYFFGGQPDYEGDSSSPVTLISSLLYFIWMALLAIQIVRRLHDLNRPGTHFLFLFIPFYNIYLLFLLYFKKGTDGPNKYGPDPLAVTPTPAPTPPENRNNRNQTVIL
jgi:uncharacterized membrane protein YhaH (DUF805 family)